MDPYIHATSSRGEGFRVDDINDIDEFAWQQVQIDAVLSKKTKRKNKSSQILSLLKNIFQKLR